jgi:DNA-directed RNA polymerase specialized sigma24 family protein
MWVISTEIRIVIAVTVINMSNVIIKTQVKIVRKSRVRRLMEDKLIEMTRNMDDYLKGYQINRKLLRIDRYEKEYFHTDESDVEAFGEAPLARARMFEIRHFVMRLENSDEKLLLYYHYIKGEPVEKCAELLGVSRSTAFRLKSRALRKAAMFKEKIS